MSKTLNQSNLWVSYRAQTMCIPSSTTTNNQRALKDAYVLFVVLYQCIFYEPAFAQWKITTILFTYHFHT